jgi:hypothetical protein
LPQGAELFDVLVHYVISSIVGGCLKCQEPFLWSAVKIVCLVETEGGSIRLDPNWRNAAALSQPDCLARCDSDLGHYSWLAIWTWRLR